MDSGAALRARAISAFRFGIKYCSIGAMLGYGALAACACPGLAALNTTANTKTGNAIVLIVPGFIDFSRDLVCLIAIRTGAESLPFRCHLVPLGKVC
jgi:hypothetical protein